MKKFICIVLCIALVIAPTLTGCGKAKETNTQPTTTEAEQSQSATTEATTEPATTEAETTQADASKPDTIQLPIVTEPTTIKILAHDCWGEKYTFTKDPMRFPVHQKWYERTGVTVEWEVYPDDQIFEVSKLRLYSGVNLPDLVYTGEDANLLGQQGIIIPIDEIIYEHCPDIVRVMEEYPNYRKAITADDGHIYKLTWLQPGSAMTNPWAPLAIRRDWVKKLGLELPRNAEELYTVFKAFKTQDPNRNGKNDEIPFTVIWGDASALTALAGPLFGVDLSWRENQTTAFGLDETRTKIIAQLERPECKDFIAYCQKLMKEGLVDPELAHSNEDLVKQKISANILGSVPTYYSTCVEYNRLSREGGDPDADWYGLTPFDLPDGTPGKMYYNDGIFHAFVVTKDCKIPEVVLKWIDWVCYSKEGHDLGYWGIEGITYEVVDGKKKLTDYVTKNPDGLSWIEAMWSVGAKPLLPIVIPVPQIKSLYEDDSTFIENDPVKYEAWQRLKDRWEPGMPPLSPTIEESKELKRIFDDCDVFYRENLAKFMNGERPLSEWDSFVQELNDRGMRREKEIWQAMLDRWNSK